MPRTYVDAKTNGFAAAETFRRESSGLIVNCLIPGFIVYGVAKVLELLNPKEWLGYLCNFYRKVVESKPQSMDTESSDTKDVNYYTMMLDVLSGLERTSVLDNTCNNKTKNKNK